MSSIRLKHLVPFLIFLAVAFLLKIGLGLNPKNLPSTLLNKPAPAIELPVLGSDERFSDKDLLGQRWILNVWASWCVGCRVEHPLLNQLADRTDIKIVGLNYKDESSDAIAWLASRGDPYAVSAVDYDGNIGIDWGVYGVPETFVIDERGMVIHKHTGPLTVDALRDEILPLFQIISSTP